MLHQELDGFFSSPLFGATAAPLQSSSMAAGGVGLGGLLLEEEHQQLHFDEDAELALSMPMMHHADGQLQLHQPMQSLHHQQQKDSFIMMNNNNNNNNNDPFAAEGGQQQQVQQPQQQEVSMFGLQQPVLQQQVSIDWLAQQQLQMQLQLQQQQAHAQALMQAQVAAQQQQRRQQLSLSHHHPSLSYSSSPSGRSSSGGSCSPSSASSSSAASDGGPSGHSTPTLVAVPSPVQSNAHKQPMQPVQSQAHLIASAAATKAAAAAKAAATVVAAAVAGRCVTSTPTSTPSSPSLLDQLSCTIPIEEGGVDKLAPPMKAKKERKTSAKKTTAAAAVPTSLAPPMMAMQQPAAFAHGAMHSSAPFAHPLDYSSGGGSEPRSPMPTGRFNNASGASTAAAAAAATSSGSGSFGFGVAEDNEPAAGDDEETRKGKLARKAELARLSRKRKKTRLTDLEAEVRRLEEELARAKRSKRDAELHSNQLSALAFQEAELAQADAVTKHKFTQVVAAMTEAVHSGVVARHEQEQLAAQAAHFSSLSAHSHSSSAVHAAVSGRPCLTGSDASNVSAKPTVLTPLIDAFMTHYGTQATNCMQHLSALDEHHAKPMRTFEFLQQIMQHNNDSSSSSSWSSLLCAELSLGASSREVGELACFRQSLSSQHVFDGDIARALNKLRVLFAKRATQQTKNLSRIRAIFSEAQFARFIEWAHRNAAAANNNNGAAAAAGAAAAVKME